MENWLIENGAKFPKLILKVNAVKEMQQTYWCLRYLFQSNHANILLHSCLQDYGNEMRACHSVQEIGDEEIIVDIPLNCLITVEMGKDTNVSSMHDGLLRPRALSLECTYLGVQKRYDEAKLPYSSLRLCDSMMNVGGKAHTVVEFGPGCP
jgi:hypothetical protein